MFHYWGNRCNIRNICIAQICKVWKMIKSNSFSLTRREYHSVMPNEISRELPVPRELIVAIIIPSSKTLIAVPLSQVRHTQGIILPPADFSDRLIRWLIGIIFSELSDFGGWCVGHKEALLLTHWDVFSLNGLSHRLLRQWLVAY